jgi:hypothetical protein
VFPVAFVAVGQLRRRGGGSQWGGV